jgi:hypothetical protein
LKETKVNLDDISLNSSMTQAKLQEGDAEYDEMADDEKADYNKMWEKKQKKDEAKRKFIEE